MTGPRPYAADNPFAQPTTYSPDNPFAPKPAPASQPTGETDGYTMLARAPELIEGGIDAARNAMTLGFGDELGNLAGALGEKLGGHLAPGQTLMDRYRERQAAEGARAAAFRETHPGVDLAGNIAGSLLGGGFAAARTPAAAVVQSLGKRMAIGAGEGAALGSVQGAGQAGEGNRTSGAIAGGVLGGVVGAATPAVVDGVTRVARSARDVLARAGSNPGPLAASPVNERGMAAMPLRPRTQPSGPTGPERRAQDLLLNRLGNEGKTVEQVAGEAIDATGQPYTLMEAGQSPRNFADYVAQTPTKGGRTLTQFAEARNYEAPGRVRGALEQSFGIPREESGLLMDEVIQRQSANAADDYAKALAHGPVKSAPVLAAYQRLERLLPEARAEALRTAQTLDIPEERLFAGDAPTVEYLHLFKQSVDKVIQVAKRSNEAGVAASGARLKGLADLQRTFLDALKTEVPAYRTAAERFAGEEATKAAMDAADGVLRMTGEQVRRTLAAMSSEGERDAFRRVALDRLHQRVGETSYGGNVKLTLDRNVNDADLLRALFPSEGAYTAFAKRLGMEGEMAKTYRTLTGNSATARRLFESADAGQAMDVATKTLTGRFGDAARAMARPLLTRAQGITPEVADVLGQYLTATGGDLDALLRQLAERERSRLATQGAGRLLSRTGAQTSASTLNRP